MTKPVPCGIRDIDLNAPLPDIRIEGEERSVLAYFWHDNIPVGRRFFLSSELPIESTSLTALAAACSAAGIAAANEQPKGGLIAPEDVSVVICTRDRPEHLRGCIDFIEKTDPAPGEIIVVDNSSGDGTLADVLDAHPKVTMIKEPRQGLSNARNTGLQAARGKIVAFTDDDVEVPQNWIERIAKAFSEAEIGAVTGLVLPGQLDSDAEFAFEMDIGGLSTSLVPQEFGPSFISAARWTAAPVWDIGAGANLAVRKSVALELEGFDERLGAGASGCSEDSEFLYRLLNAGWTCRYRPEVYVKHHHRSDIAALKIQMRAYMRGHVTALLVQFSKTRHIGNLTRIFFGLPRYFAGWGARRILSCIGFSWFEFWGPTARSTQFSQIRGSAEGVFHLLLYRNPSNPGKSEPNT